MNISITQEIFEKYPALSLGVVIANDIDNSKKIPEVIRMLCDREKQLREILQSDKLSEHPNIKVWREAFRAFGAKPKKYKSSIEALLSRILNGEDLPDINTLVNIYNYISIKYILPVGGDDLDKVEGDLKLTIAEGSERFVQLGSKEETSPKPGEVVYMDDKEVTCRRWNWRECDRTKMTPESKNLILVTESLTSKELTQMAVQELAQLITQFCGGETKHFILDKDNPSIEVS